MRYLFLGFVFCMTGCTAFSEDIAPQMAKAVDRYCAEVPQLLRAETRATIQSLVKPGTVIGGITCPGDTP